MDNDHDVVLHCTVFIWVLLTMQRTGAKRFQTSELLESILSEVFMPCEQNVSNVTFYRSTKPPATISNVNTTLQSEALNTTDHDSFVNESVASYNYSHRILLVIVI